MESIFTKRNAAVGFVTLKALSRYLDRRKKQKSRRSRVALYALLGLFSLGLLAGLAYVWRQHSATMTETLEAAGEAVTETAESAAELAEEAAAAAAEPIPAT